MPVFCLRLGCLGVERSVAPGAGSGIFLSFPAAQQVRWEQLPDSVPPQGHAGRHETLGFPQAVLSFNGPAFSLPCPGSELA